VNTHRKSTPGDSSATHVIDFVRGLIVRGELRPGSRLPAERELAARIGVSRPTVRAGLHALAAMGVVKTRHGAGTFIPEKPMLVSEPLSILAAVHGFSREEMFEARRILEASAAALAAERATAEQRTVLAEEVTDMFASLHDPREFLVHDIRFHRTIAAASGNPILASLVEMVSALFYDERSKTAGQATRRNMQEAAEMHRQIYKAIRTGKPDRARTLMNEHLLAASAHLAAEETQDRKR
jgi:GntR family transcriptional regulator, transcriptional repressor for pyruvate dehydrogenase complex